MRELELSKVFDSVFMSEIMKKRVVATKSTVPPVNQKGSPNPLFPYTYAPRGGPRNKIFAGFK